TTPARRANGVASRTADETTSDNATGDGGERLTEAEEANAVARCQTARGSANAARGRMRRPSNGATPRGHVRTRGRKSAPAPVAARRGRDARRDREREIAGQATEWRVRLRASGRRS